jgi:hypothetical protein
MSVEAAIKSRLVVSLLALVAAACSSAESADVASGAASPPVVQAGGQAPPGAGSEAGWTPPPGVNLVVHDRLAAFVPTLDGWRPPEVRGETDWPTLVSRVYANYERHGPPADRLELELGDAVMNPLVMAPLPEVLASDAAAAREGLERTKIGRFPGVQEWEKEARNGTVTVVLANRFTVKFTGSYVESLNVIRNAVEKVELEKLAALK